MPVVSIIMPVYNCEKYLNKTIDSIISQTIEDWELIIVNDCSTDDSLKIIKKYNNSKFVIINNDSNLGAAASRNIAINKATGRYITFIDSDDIWVEDKLEKQLNFINKNNYSFIYSSYEKIDENDKPIGIVTAPLKVDYEYMLKNVAFQISTVMIDTNKINKDKISFPKLKTSEDTAMYLQILKDDIVAYGILESIVKYRVRKKSLSSNKIENTARLWKAYGLHNINIFKKCYYIVCHVMNSFLRNFGSYKIRRLIEIIRLFSVKQLLDFIFFPFIYALSLMCKSLCKDIWLVSENPNEACDNGYIFYKYLKEKQNNINSYYVINKKSKDYGKVKCLGNIIRQGSLKHWIYYFNAKYIITTQKYANPSKALFYLLHKFEIIKVPRVFLQHGIICSNDCSTYYYNESKFRLFICGAKREYEYVKNNFGYPKNWVVFTGLARFDNLNLESNSDERLILITPTWRKWLKSQKEFDEFVDNYYKIIENERLIKVLEENNITLQFVLHKNMNKYKITHNSLSENIRINHNDEIDIQDLLNRTSLIVSDYSSIFMDVAYRNKANIYYQFDKSKYKAYQFKKNYFTFEKDGFGDILYDAEDVINKIIFYVKNNFVVEKEYIVRMNKFFEQKDKKNCKRIFKAIERI